MKGNQSIKEFFMELINKMEREDTASLDMSLELPDKTKVTFVIFVSKIEKPDGTTVEWR